MAPRTRLISLVLLVLGFFNVPVNGGKANTCTTPGTVTEGDPIAVTCTYHQNLESNKQDFYIYKTQPGTESVIVAICAWEDAGISCDLKPGYSVKVHEHTVTLNISSAEPSHAGSYSCSSLPPEKDTKIEPCSLSVQRKTVTDKINIFCNKDGDGGQASVMCVFPESLDAITVTLERHDLRRKNRKPEEVMRCDKKEETCSSALPGYETIITTEADNFKTFRVKIPSYAPDKSGLYVCKTDSESTPYDMCTLKPDEVVTRPEPEEEALLALVVPLYLILVCLILLVVIVVALVIKRCRDDLRKRSANPDIPLMNGRQSPS